MGMTGSNMLFEAIWGTDFHSRIFTYLPKNLSGAQLGEMQYPIKTFTDNAMPEILMCVVSAYKRSSNHQQAFRIFPLEKKI